MRFVWKYEYCTVHLNGDFCAENDKFEPIEYRLRLRFSSPDPQGSALARFFRVVAVVGWSSSTGDAFADVSCHSLYSDVTCTEIVRMPFCGPRVETFDHLCVHLVADMQFYRAIVPGKIVIISSCTLPLGMVITMIGFFVQQKSAHLAIACIGCA